MWVVEACFEGSEQPYRKLLKPGRRYAIGRKAPAQLILAEKTVSQDAGFVEVQAWAPPLQSLMGVSRLPAWPMLQLHVGKKLIRVIARDDEDHWQANRDTFVGEESQPSAVREMADGDRIVVSKNAPAMQFLWEPIFFCVAPGVVSTNVLREQHQSLANLGAAIIESERVVAGCTHFVTDVASTTASFLNALVSCVHIVTGSYITDLIRVDGTESAGKASALEQECILPDIEEHFPPSDSALDSTTYEELKAKSSPDEKRKSLFHGITILFASTDEESRKAFKDRTPAFLAAGARIETCMPSALARLAEDKEKSERYLENKLAAAQLHAHPTIPSGEQSTQSPNSNLVIIADSSSHSPELWYVLFSKISRRLGIPMPVEGVKALSNSIMLKAPTRFLISLAPEQAEEEDCLQNESDRRTRHELQPSPQGPEEQAGFVPLTQEMHSLSTHVNRQKTPPQQTESQQTQPQRTQTEQAQANSGAPITPSRRPKRRAGIERADPFADLFGSTASTEAPHAPPATESQMSEIGATQLSPSRGGSMRLRRNVTASREQPRRSDVWRSIFEESAPTTSSAVVTLNDEESSLATQGISTSERYTKRFRKELDEADQRESQREHASQSASQQDQADPDRTIQPIRQPQRQIERKRRAEEDAEDERDALQQHEQIPATLQTGTAPDPAPSSTLPISVNATSPETIREQRPDPSSQAGATQSDTKFLQSIASMKKTKSKKPVDALDREFDRLRIVRPQREANQTEKGDPPATMLVEEDTVEDPAYRAWQQMTVDDFEMGIVGNFVQVDFVPLLRPRRSTSGDESNPATLSAATQASWSGRPNFKKFRAKDRTNRDPVALHVAEVNDFGVGPTYAANASAARQRFSQARPDVTTSAAKASQTATQKKRSIFDKVMEDEGAEKDQGKSHNGYSSTQGTALGGGTLPAVKQRGGSSRPPIEHDEEAVQVKGVARLSGRKASKAMVDVYLDVDGDSMDDSGNFPDGSGEENPDDDARRAKGAVQAGRRSQNQVRQHATKDKRKLSDVIALSSDVDEEMDDAEDSDTGFTFQGFKRSRTQATSRSRK